MLGAMPIVCSSKGTARAVQPRRRRTRAWLSDERQRVGFRVLAIATKVAAPRAAASGAPTPYGTADEAALVLQGYVAFLDPPKPTCAVAIDRLQAHGITVKVITCDNELVARNVCKAVGLVVDAVVLGTDVERMSDAALADAAEVTTLFARVSPAHKQRIIQALQARKHTVGFLGDGINDAPALHAADVGISVDTAVDIAKASADMILLEKSLLVIDDGVLEGRKVFANISKYVRMGASSTSATCSVCSVQASWCHSCRCCRSRSSRTTCSTTSDRPRSRPMTSTPSSSSGPGRGTSGRSPGSSCSSARAHRSSTTRPTS